MNQSPHDWQELTRLTGGQALIVERVRIAATGVAPNGVAIEGAFALPRLAELSHEDQVFVAAFVGAHGSIKEMEQVFGVSYPTIKARLNRLAAALDPIERDEAAPAGAPPADASRADVLDRLAAGEISADEAVNLLNSGRP
jgi:hypothetical protein